MNKCIVCKDYFVVHNKLQMLCPSCRGIIGKMNRKKKNIPQEIYTWETLMIKRGRQLRGRNAETRKQPCPLISSFNKEVEKLQ